VGGGRLDIILRFSSASMVEGLVLARTREVEVPLTRAMV
jgi:hypothetical protein